MTAGEKILLSVSVVMSWLFVALLKFIFSVQLPLAQALAWITIGIVIWLTPFALLALFFKKLRFALPAFALGSAGFLLIDQSVSTIIGVIILTLGFIYWFLNVRYSVKQQLGFSFYSLFSGIGLFLTILAAFGALLYLSSPFVTREIHNPQISQKFFDIIYTPVSSFFLSAIHSVPADQRPTPEQLKPQIYNIVNASITELARSYQPYVPFVFAGGVFFLLRAIFLVLSYILYFFVSLVGRLLLSVGWLRKETIQTPQETIHL